MVTVQEDTPISTTLTTLSAQDEEADAVSFYLIGQHTDVFSLQGADVILQDSLDFETESWFLVQLV